MLAHPLRHLTSLAQLVGRPDRFFTPPLHLQIEPVNRCNMACPMCKPAGMGLAQDLSLEGLRGLLTGLRPQYVTLSGLGEPLLHRDFLAMIGLLKQSGSLVNTTTNGILLEKMAPDLAASGLDLISVSLDAASRQAYGRMRNERFYDQVRQGIKALVEAKRRRGGGPAIRASMVISSENYRETAQFVEHCHGLGVEMVLFQPLDPQDIADASLYQAPPADLRAELLRAQAKAQELGLGSNLPDLLARFDLFWGADAGPRLARQCQIIWFSAYVASDLGLRPCCRFAGYPEMTLGHAGSGAEMGGMNQGPMVAFRSQISQGLRPHPVCRACIPETLGEMLFGRRRY